MTVILNAQELRQIEFAVDLLRAGEPVALPTETVYGLAAPVNNEAALAKVFSLKARPNFDPLIVHVHSKSDLPRWVKGQGSLHEKLISKFWPGPLTLLFEKRDSVPDLCTAGSPWVAVRSPAHPVFRQVLEHIGAPLAAPSANRFARISPTEAAHVVEELGASGLEAVLDGGPCALGLESTVVKIEEDEGIEVIRLGALGLEEIQDAIGSGVHLRVRESGTGALNEAPGQAASHYAPSTPLFFLESSESMNTIAPANKAKSLLIMAYPHGALANEGPLWKRVLVLSAEGSDKVAASKLFRELRAADKGAFESIYALAADPRGLGAAINDRLRRAAHTKASPHGL